MMCSVSLGGESGDLLKAATFIIWDECPMMHRYNFEALDKCLKDIMKTVDPRCEAMPFGGKVIVFGGDFRQCATVIERGSKAQIIHASLPQSYLWRSMEVLEMTINMRVRQAEGNFTSRGLHSASKVESSLCNCSSNNVFFCTHSHTLIWGTHLNGTPWITWCRGWGWGMCMPVLCSSVLGLLQVRIRPGRQLLQNTFSKLEMDASEEQRSTASCTYRLP